MIANSCLFGQFWLLLRRRLVGKVSLIMKLRWFWHNLDYIILGLLALGFFVATSLFNYQTQTADYTKFLSPDETANYFFARQYAETGEIAVFEPANLIAEEVVHPRSIRSDHGWLKPVSFLGIILVFGQIGAWVGVAVIPYLTPLFASLGIIIFYAFVRRLFGRQTALISAFLLAAFPVYFFYTTRSLFHNILFIFFLLAAAYFLIISVPRSRPEPVKFFSWKITGAKLFSFLWSLLAGLMLGGAAGTRSSELLWLAPTLFIAWLFFARRLGLTRLVLMVAGIIIALMPVFYWNQILYSSPFYGGYGEMNKSLTELSQAGNQFFQASVHGSISQYQVVADSIIKNIFYFGYQPYQSLKMFFYYVVKMFPGLCALTFLGGLIFLVHIIRKPKRGAFLYLLSWLTLSLILVFYYGSWKFNDNPDPKRFTIGNSYTRYWLPMYIMAIPLASLAIATVSRALSKVIRLKNADIRRLRIRRLMSRLFACLGVGVYVYFSLMFTIYGSEEGLMTLYHNHFIDKENAVAILRATEPESVIVTQYNDKQLFPERRVVNALLTNDIVNDSLGKILKVYPVYYYNFAFPEKDLIYLNERRLPAFGFNLELKERRGRFGLYQLHPAIVASSSPIIEEVKK